MIMIQVEYFDIFKGGEGRDQGCSTSCPASGWPNNFKFKFFKQQIQVVKKTNTPASGWPDNFKLNQMV